MNKYLLIILYSFLLSILFFLIPNKSNFNNYIIIPLINILIIKYICGDLDRGYIFSYQDLLFLLIIISITILTLYLLKLLL